MGGILLVPALTISHHASMRYRIEFGDEAPMLCVTERKPMSDSAAPLPVTLETVQRELSELRERLEQLEDREDLRDLRAARARQAGEPGVPWTQVKAELGLD